MSKFLQLTFALAAAGIFSAGCGALSPKVGAEQDASTCGASSSTSSPYGGSSTTGDAGSCGGAARDPRCAEDAGYEDGDCDRCEDTYCCSPRFQCYDDPACFNADENLDQCNDDAESSDAGDEESARAACWDAFTSTPGPLAKNLHDCEAQYCKDVCEVP
ncbi:MAG: hypothetical protein ACRELY_08990 [Polyangiaceae bacterium]